MRNILIGLAIGALASIPGRSVAENKPIPIETFAALPALTDPVMSADGNHVAALAKADDKTQIVILDANRPGIIERSITLGENNVEDVNWAGSHRLLVTVVASEKVRGGFDFQFLRLIAIDTLTGNSRLIDPDSRGIYAGDVLYTDPGGSWALVASQDDMASYPSVKRVDLATGKAERIEKARDRVWDWFADEKGVVRAGIAYEANEWILWYRDTPDEKLRKIKGRVDEEEDGAVDRFIFRGGQGWIVTNKRTGRFGLYEYDPKTNEIGKAIFEHPDVDIDDVFYDGSTGQIEAIRYEQNRRRLHWLRPDLAKLQAKIDRALPRTVNVPQQLSEDKNRVLVHAQGASDPGRYFILDRKRGTMHAIIDPYPAIDPPQLAETEWISYRARDGLPIHAYLTLPKGKEAKRLPLIVMPHGGPYERDHWDYDPEVQMLVNRGYAVLQPQFRGSTGFGRDFVTKGYGEWGLKMQDDLDDGVAWLTGAGIADPGRVCIVGSSYGGYAALWAAVRSSSIYRCAASYAGVFDLPKQVSHSRKMFSAPRYYREWRDKVDGEGLRDLSAVSPIRFADRIQIPVLIGHGEKDRKVLASQSRAMVKALTDAKANVRSVFYPGSGHGFATSEDQSDWFRKLEAFLKQHNPY